VTVAQAVIPGTHPGGDHSPIARRDRYGTHSARRRLGSPDSHTGVSLRRIEKPGAFWSDYFTRFTSHALSTVMKYVAPSFLVHASWIIFAGM
jgi:hypothetical protein